MSDWEQRVVRSEVNRLDVSVTLQEEEIEQILIAEACKRLGISAGSSAVSASVAFFEDGAAMVSPVQVIAQLKITVDRSPQPAALEVVNG